MAQSMMKLIIAPQRDVWRDFKANSGPILFAIAALLIYIILSSLVIWKVEQWAFWRAAYFTVINVTTVGFGDVTAATQAGKIMSGVNAFVGLVIFGVLVALITLAFQPGQFTGTASCVVGEALAAKTDKDAPSEESTDTVIDFLGSLQRLLRDDRHLERGHVRISVHDHDKEAMSL